MQINLTAQITDKFDKFLKCTMFASKKNKLTGRHNIKNAFYTMLLNET